MNPRTSSSRGIEEFHLRLVKAIVVILMSLALLAVLALVGFSALQYTQTPTSPAPPQVATLKAVSGEELAQVLQEQERKRLEQEKRVREFGNAASLSVPAGETSSVLKYMAEANALLACADEFKRLAELDVLPQTEAEKLAGINNLRGLIENLASKSDRGDAWVSAMQSFVCQLLKNPTFAQLRKEGKIRQVFNPAIQFHAAIWSRNVDERDAFNQRELTRVQTQRLAEELRVEAAHVTARMALAGAAAVLGIFMLMALYLIFARIERNLTEVSASLAGRVNDVVPVRAGATEAK